jgi:PPK2 family polyphosphate:nucleotide phosphotransferase
VKIDDYRIDGDKVRLSRFDPGDDGGLKRPDAEAAMPDLLDRMLDLQERLFAGRTHALLIVLQGRDAAGKDGTIKHVMGGFNPLGTRVVAFKAPSELERSHDFLWRVHACTPPLGHVAIFNRSHYEDVLVPAIKGSLTGRQLAARHEHIRGFEAVLDDAGVAVLKLFLHISKDEQRERLQQRLDSPEKRWKFDPSDLQARAEWDRYTDLYEAVLARTATADAPWYVIPADRKWFRNYLVASIVVRTLEGMKLRYPDPPPGLDGVTID